MVAENTTRVLDWEYFAGILGEALAEIVGEPVSSLTPSSHLLDDIGLDSFGALLLLDALEARFGVLLAPTDDEPTAGRMLDLVIAAGGRR